MILGPGSAIGREALQHWLGYWTYVGERTVESWYRLARKQARGDVGSVPGVLGEAADFWSDVLAASMVAWRGVDSRPAMVVFSMDVRDTVAGPKELPIFSLPLFAAALPSEQPKVLGMERIGGRRGKGTELSDENLQVVLTDDRAALDFRVKTIPRELSAARLKKRVAPSSKGGAQPELAQGVYKAVVVIGEVPVAEVIIGISKGDARAASVQGRHIAMRHSKKAVGRRSLGKKPSTQPSTSGAARAKQSNTSRRR